MLRIDDTDDERSTAFEASIRADLQWMRMDWDREDGQSTRIDAITKRLHNCLHQGGRINALKHRKNLAQTKGTAGCRPPPVYDRAALALSADEIAARGGGRKTALPLQA